MYGGIVYGLVGLVPTVPGFWKFMLTIVLFNLTTASVVLWLSIAFASMRLASLVGTLVMLFKWVAFIEFLTEVILMSLPFKPFVHRTVDQSGHGHAGATMASHDLVLPCCLRGAGRE